jgi:hypothetical protein
VTGGRAHDPLGSLNVSSAERCLLAEQAKLNALRERIQATTYMKAPAVRAHLNMSRASLHAVPGEVLPWVPGLGRERVERRYHPSDVAAYPARARRWRRGKDEGQEAEVLEEMRRELEERDAALIGAALTKESLLGQGPER